MRKLRAIFSANTYKMPKMADDGSLPESDRVADLPHPRETSVLFGQDDAEQVFLNAAKAGRLHHAWMITGLKGVGKATLAWRIARTVLAGGPAEGQTTLDMDRDAPVFRRVAALGEPRLSLLRRPWDHDRKRLKAAITVDEARKLKSFFALSAADGGWRVAIIDAADDMNIAAANALLKSLEEPPQRALFILVAHQPGALLPTIRSRCRTLACPPLQAEDLAWALDAAGVPPPRDMTAAAQLSGGSPGQAAQLIADGGMELYADIIDALSSAPNIDRDKALALANACTGRGAETRYALTRHLVSLVLARLARHGVTGPLPQAAPGEAPLFARLSPDNRAARAWADLSQTLTTQTTHAVAVNLDPSGVILDMLLRIDKEASRL